MAKSSNGQSNDQPEKSKEFDQLIIRAKKVKSWLHHPEGDKWLSPRQAEAALASGKFPDSYLDPDQWKIDDPQKLINSMVEYVNTLKDQIKAAKKNLESVREERSACIKEQEIRN